MTSGPDIGVLGFAPVQVDLARADVLRAAGIDSVAALAAKRRRASDDGWRRDVALAAQWAATAAAIEAQRCR